MKEYSALPKAPALLEPFQKLILCRIQDTLWGRPYSSVEMKSMHSTALVDWAEKYGRIFFHLEVEVLFYP